MPGPTRRSPSTSETPTRMQASSTPANAVRSISRRAGIMPITNFSNLVRFQMPAARSSTLAARARRLRRRHESIRKLGTEVVTDLCRRLLDMDAPGLHFYTMNQAEPTHRFGTTWAWTQRRAEAPVPRMRLHVIPRGRAPGGEVVLDERACYLAGASPGRVGRPFMVTALCCCDALGPRTAPDRRGALTNRRPLLSTDRMSTARMDFDPKSVNSGTGAGPDPDHTRCHCVVGAP